MDKALTPELDRQLADTRAAFDSVAADYDGPRGNNGAIQDMRTEMWRWLDRCFTGPSRLIDIGCGTGLDAVRMAGQGHSVWATDWSPAMVERTAGRAQDQGLAERVRALLLGAQELARLEGDGQFDGAYSNLGPLNCVPDLDELARQCARLLRPDGQLAFTVIGRYCPWEIGHYALQRRWSRIAVRFTRDTVAVGMNKHRIWTRYYTPDEFYRAFAPHFELVHRRGLCLFVPPPYLDGLRQRHPRWHEWLWRLDRRLAGWPGLRAMGDHFLIVMKRRGPP
ncbi:class I SAM-dependent methyltransferase [Pelomonas sp. SE-A7]|uniref:class I SAM-dependent methyltransferase n=1 Tax=Pelomonas sp. SE-A7 TaxID=3054953 RepID=UPI00259C9B76|nr:class I SAM-dependent methyltransferase [Pelomonas sp. SE-A7]MDM4765396.1 methyltransferase domain-containing protein [Pelomonas sp. SE-A7]